MVRSLLPGAYSALGVYRGGTGAMIETCVDSWARHLAAVGEARRLLGLVLVNNATFRAFCEASGALPGAASVPADLAQDPQFTAYVHLTKALEALAPVPSAGELAHRDRLTLRSQLRDIPPLETVNGAGQPPVAPGPGAAEGGLARLKARLDYVLADGAEGAPIAQGPAQVGAHVGTQVPVQVPIQMVLQETVVSEEAHVAIVRSSRR